MVSIFKENLKGTSMATSGTSTVALRGKGETSKISKKVRNRSGVAGAVLQTPLSLINLLIH